tara:strand:+ start:142162 stop:142950 length:789 start_codon:yes stop_codon:yes gene_type:complete
MIFLLYLLTGVVAGTLSGMLGIGGGIIVVPVLIVLLPMAGVPHDIVVHMAVASALATIVVTSFSAAHKHYHNGNIDLTLLKRILMSVIPGVVVGSIAAHFIPGRGLEIFVGVVLALVALRLLLSKQTTDATEPHAINKFMFMGLGFIFAVIASMVGAGGGIFFVPFLLYCGYQTRMVIGVSSAISWSVGLLSTLIYIAISYSAVHVPWATGYVYWPAVLGIVITSFFFARVGVKLSQVFPVSILRKMFAALLIVVAVKMLMG